MVELPIKDEKKRKEYMHKYGEQRTQLIKDAKKQMGIPVDKRLKHPSEAKTETFS